MKTPLNTALAAKSSSNLFRIDFDGPKEERHSEFCNTPREIQARLRTLKMLATNGYTIHDLSNAPDTLRDLTKWYNPFFTQLATAAFSSLSAFKNYIVTVPATVCHDLSEAAVDSRKPVRVIVFEDKGIICAKQSYNVQNAETFAVYSNISLDTLTIEAK